MTKINTYNVQNPEMIELINTGCKLDKLKKDCETRLDGIKTELEVLRLGKHVTPEGNSVTISETAVYTEIDPEEAKRALREKRLGKSFMECVKVNVTCLKRFLSDQELSSLRTLDKYTRKNSFK